jgi:ferredoxin
MPFVISRLCRDCLDLTCVEPCPVDCIVAKKPDADLDVPNQLFIDPEECIDCGICEGECGWEAIFSHTELPDAFADDVATNAVVAEHRDAFEIPTDPPKTPPSHDAVTANKQKWGLT